ncbi:MAG: FAD-binding oxidoreductase [Candidatus Nanopelagicales bacterium]|jgi:glycine/D-amino acid oxidase-like deaminating enzyme|nr:FAD-binding oxidoreductase [Candidatus Nanopelagicales bacterium]
MSMTPRGFWHTTKPYTPGPALVGDLHVDVAIVGGGYTGMATAHFLREADPGMSIAILESEWIGFGASGRNAGFNMTKIGMMHSLTARRFGRARAREAHLYADRAVTLLHDLVGTLDLDCDYEHPGFLWVATAPKYSDRLLKEIALVHRLGITGIHLLDHGELLDRVDSPCYVGPAWWEPNMGLVNPAKLAWAWRDLVVREGVQVFEGTPVSSVEPGIAAGKVVLNTRHGRVTAGKAVLATNAWSHHFPQLVRRQVPVWTYIVLTEPLTDAQLGSIGWKGREGVEDFRNLVHYYRLTPDNRLLMGGRDVALGDGVGMDFDDDERTWAALRQDVRSMFPGLRDVRFSHAWGGPVSATLDMFPAIGYAGSKDVVYSFGCVGHGVSTTHLNGQVVADLLLERDTELTDTFFVDRRLAPFPPGGIGHATAQRIADYLRWEDRRFDTSPA